MIVDLLGGRNQALNARRGGVETERQRLIAERQVLDKVLNSVVRAVKSIEEEGRCWRPTRLVSELRPHDDFFTYAASGPNG